MRVEYVDGGESSIDSLNSHDPNSSGEDESPNSLPELHHLHIPFYDLLDRTHTMRPPSISSSSSTIPSSADLFQIVAPDMEETSSEVAASPKTQIVSDDVAVLGGSPTQSPPRQVMDRSSEAAPDPHRIPAAVFETSTSIRDVDWSNLSNDSVFSLRFGSASFLKDHRSNDWCRESVRPTKREPTLTPDRWPKSPSPPSEEVAADYKAVERPDDRKISEGNPTVVEKVRKDYPIEDDSAERLNLPDKNDDIGASQKQYSFTAKKKNSYRKPSRSRCLRIFPCLSWPSWCFATCCLPLCRSCKCKFPSCSCCSCSLAFRFFEHSCCSCKRQSVTRPNSKDPPVTEKQGYKLGGCCSCFSCGFSSCFSCKCLSFCSSCRSSCSRCLRCVLCRKSCSCFSCSCSRRWCQWRPHCC